MHAKHGEPPLLRDPAAAPVELRRIKWDTWSGMFYSDITAYFIILATAVTLNVAGITDIQTLRRRQARCGRLQATLHLSCSRSESWASA